MNKRINKWEEQAQKYLESIGYIFINNNIRIGRREIDLLMQDGEEKVIIEVKKRNNPLFYNINRRQLINFQEFIMLYFKEPIRFDLILITNNEIYHQKHIYL